MHSGCKPLVSVVVPIYMVEKHLPRAIRSVVEQTYTAWELILVIDGSTDHCQSIAEKSAREDSRISVLVQENAGVSAARNAGIRAAEGTYLCFLDPDDYLLPNCIHDLVSLCSRTHSDIAVSTGIATDFNFASGMKNRSSDVFNGHTALVELMYYKIPVACYAKLYKREFLQQHHILFNTTLVTGEDFDFTARSFQLCETVSSTKDTLYFHSRTNPSSAMTSFDAARCWNGLVSILLIRNMVLKISQNDRTLQKAVSYAVYHTADDLLQWIYNSGVAQSYPELTKTCLRLAKSNARLNWGARVSLGRSCRIRSISYAPKITCLIWAKLRTLVHHVSQANRKLIRARQN